MATHESIFTGSNPSLSDVKTAIVKIEKLFTAQKLRKKVIYDMLAGFRILEHSAQQKEVEAYELIIEWSNLFLKIQSKINTQDETIRGHFEKTVPSAVTYMIGSLQHKPEKIISYHFQLLEMIHELLSNVRPEVLEKVSNFETGIIACVWFPIKFVGDFNTQMMALRLLVMLLKCVDETRLQNELDHIRGSERPALKDKLRAAIAVGNFHAAKFEKTARELLNTYNMQLAKNILVYSFRCKTFKFAENIEFYKPMNADNFWIDFNYAPRTLSFNGRCQANKSAQFTNCSVSLQIVKLTLNQVNLHVQFKAPAQLIKNTNEFPDVRSVTTAEIVLPLDEAKRLLENTFVLKYYNRTRWPIESNANVSVVRLHSTTANNNVEAIENARENATNSNSIAAPDCSLQLEDDNNFVSTFDVENKENVPPTKGKNAAMMQAYATERASRSKQFQKNDILVGYSKATKNDQEKTNQTLKKNDAKTVLNFKFPHLPNLEKEFIADKLRSRLRTNNAKLVNYSTSTSDSNSTPKKTNKVSTRKETAKNQKNKFFRTQILNSDSDYKAPTAKKAPRKRNTRNKKSAATNNVIVKKTKKINEVKPMLQSNKNCMQSESHEANNQPHNQSTTHNVITDPDLQQNIITIDISESGSSNIIPDIYENQNVSDAEPGQSYRNFRIRVKKERENNIPEAKRQRKSLTRSVKKNLPPNTCQLTRITQTADSPKCARKRPSPELMDPFDILKGHAFIPPKMRKMDSKTATSSINPTVYTAEIEFDAPSCAKKNIIEKSTPHNHNNVTFNQNSINNSPYPTNETIEHQPLRNNINNVHPEPTLIKEIAIFPTNSTFNNAQVNETDNNYDDIQECRREMGQCDMSISNDSDEFSDFPTFPSMMDISDMLPLPECESTNNRTTTISKNANSTNTNLSSSTKTNPSDLSICQNQNENTNEMLEHHRNLIYYSRSENDSDSEQSIVSSNNNCPAEQPVKIIEHIFLMPQAPLKSFRKSSTNSTKCHVTTTATTSIITQQDQFVHQQQQFLVNLAASASNTPLNLTKSCSRATTTTTTKTVVKERQEINLNSFAGGRQSVNIRTPTPAALRRESSNMLTNYKNNLNVQLDHLNYNIKKNSAKTYIQKTCDIAERLLNEIERERGSLLELEANVERLTRQLNWQHEAYQRKSQQFECFKQNIDSLLSALNNINLMEEIKTDTQNKLQQLQQTSDSIAMHQWRDFINESTENLLRDISSLSNL